MYMQSMPQSFNAGSTEVLTPHASGLMSLTISDQINGCIYIRGGATASTIITNTVGSIKADLASSAGLGQTSICLHRRTLALVFPVDPDTSRLRCPYSESNSFCAKRAYIIKRGA